MTQDSSVRLVIMSVHREIHEIQVRLTMLDFKKIGCITTESRTYRGKIRLCLVLASSFVTLEVLGEIVSNGVLRCPT